MNRASMALLAAVVAGSQACHRTAVPPTGSGPAPAPRPQSPPGAPSPAQTIPIGFNLPPTLPQIPLVQGPLEPRVVYPSAFRLITSRDSNFIFGSVGNGLASLTVNGQDVRVWPNGAFLGWVPNPPPTLAQFELIARLGADSAVVVHPVRVAGMTPPVPDSLKPPPPTITDTVPTWIVLRDTSLSLSDTDRVVIGRPTPNSTYRWFLLPNTRVQLTGRYPGFARVRLDSGLDIWVDAVDATTFATDTTPPRRVVGNLKVRSNDEWVDVQFPIAERPAYQLEERDRSIDLTLYGARGNTDLVSYPSTDSLVRHIEWAQFLNDRVRYSVEMNSSPFGYLVWYENGVLTLRIRRPPGLGSWVSGPGSRSRSSLSGLTIAVDAGHPPAGATGPTGLYEADAALPVGAALKRMLEERGATVVMTRESPDAVELAMRPVIARRQGAHAFVSLHYNAYPDGVNPFTRPNGIEVYFYRPHSESLARAVQSELIAKQQLEDQGIHFRSLAVVRSTWFPAVLAEGGFLLVPEQENAMRTAEWQERYARAVVDGLEKYFRAVRAR
ncbi:MAG: N-acetylmuramoyl-L-alanine amidase [Gemmatimonadota bacterium]